MEYQGFVVRAFEREPGKWRAKVLRPGREPLIKGCTRILQFVTGMDRTTPSAALLAALEAIDAGAFTRAPTLPETYWRGRGRRRMRGRSASQTVLSKSDPD
jgi:hypothetical protein